MENEETADFFLFEKAKKMYLFLSLERKKKCGSDQ